MFAYVQMRKLTYREKKKKRFIDPSVSPLINARYSAGYQALPHIPPTTHPRLAAQRKAPCGCTEMSPLIDGSLQRLVATAERKMKKRSFDV